MLFSLFLFLPLFLIFDSFEGFFYFVCFEGGMSGSVQGYFWLCVQGSLPVVLKELYELLGLEPRSTACKQP